ncbi:MAG: hypothetical protein ACC628_17595 [Pirellulaceae bacterium]
MTPAIYEQLVGTLRREPLRLKELHALATDAGCSWSADQMHLLLACMDGIELDATDGDNPTVRIGRRSQQDELVEAIATVVRSQGARPLPTAQVMQLLPKQFTTSETQIKKLAKEASGLQVVGPGLIGLEK